MIYHLVIVFCFQIDLEICFFADCLRQTCILFWRRLTGDSRMLYEEHKQLCSNAANGLRWICGDITVLMEDPRLSLVIYFPSDWHVYDGGCRIRHFVAFCLCVSGLIYSVKHFSVFQTYWAPFKTEFKMPFKVLISVRFLNFNCSKQGAIRQYHSKVWSRNKNK